MRILINRIVRLICFETMKVDFDYDAFVICNPEGKDLEFANKLVDTMQASPYNLKLCAPWRNAGACSPNTRECTRDRYSTDVGSFWWYYRTISTKVRKPFLIFILPLACHQGTRREEFFQYVWRDAKFRRTFNLSLS